jgi:hypothetical protein
LRVLEYAALFESSGGSFYSSAGSKTYYYTLDGEIELLNYASADLYGKGLFDGVELLGVSTASAGGDLLAQITKAATYDFDSFVCDFESDDLTGELTIAGYDVDENEIYKRKIYRKPYQTGYNQGGRVFNVYDIEKATPLLDH